MTDEQRERLERTQMRLGPCIDARAQILSEFLDQIGFPEPQRVSDDAARFVPEFSTWLDAQEIQPEDFGFLVLRLGLLIGEVIAQPSGGTWFLDDNPSSPSFACFVVGRFGRHYRNDAVVDPLKAAADLLKEREGLGPLPTSARPATNYVLGDGRVVRTLIGAVAAIEADLR